MVLGTAILSNGTTVFTMLVVVVVALLIVGLIKKLKWLCAMAIAIAIFVGFAESDKVIEIGQSIVSTFDGAIDPLKDDDYSDMIGDEAWNNPGADFGEIGMDENTDD